mgnify:CR=1 FL=1
MLVELLKRNPVVAIPVVVARLEQKDEEWCVRSWGRKGRGGEASALMCGWTVTVLYARRSAVYGVWEGCAVHSCVLTGNKRAPCMV